MPDQTEAEPQSGSMSVETMAKGVALIATVGLGLAFLHDTIFFRPSTYGSLGCW